MQTIYLPTEVVDAYLLDLAARIDAQPKSRPQLWVPIGNSGDVIFQRLMQINPLLYAPTIVANVDRKTGTLVCEGGDLRAEAAGKRVFVIDSSVHSGTTMSLIIDQIAANRPTSVSSYTLVMKRGTAHVPSLWGVTINDHDRAYFLLDKIPNNRLGEPPHDTHIRLLKYQDIKRPPIVSGLDSIDRVTWADRYYDSRCSEQDRRTYLLFQNDRNVGFLTLSRVGTATIRVDEVAVDRNEHKKGFCGILLRWAETFARQTDCEKMEMWAIENAVPIYERFGYEKNPNELSLDLDGEIYFRMRKRVIHHLKLANQ